MEEADYCLRPVICGYARHCLAQALRGEQGFLDGIVSCNSCDAVRRLYDNWVQEAKPPYAYFLDVPKKVGEAQVERYRNILAGFKTSLEQHFGVEITEERLQEQIKIHNEARRLQRELYALRKARRPPLTGAEMLAVMIAGTAIPKERYIALLKHLLADCKEMSVPDSYSARLMLVGGAELDDPAYLDAIEEMGGLIVADSLDYGSRICWNDIGETNDSLGAIAHHYLMSQIADARTFGTSTLLTAASVPLLVSLSTFHTETAIIRTTYRTINGQVKDCLTYNNT